MDIFMYDCVYDSLKVMPPHIHEQYYWTPASKSEEERVIYFFATIEEL